MKHFSKWKLDIMIYEFKHNLTKTWILVIEDNKYYHQTAIEFWSKSDLQSIYPSFFVLQERVSESLEDKYFCLAKSHITFWKAVYPWWTIPHYFHCDFHQGSFTYQMHKSESPSKRLDKRKYWISPVFLWSK